MKYVGIQTQKGRNNSYSLLLLCLFPLLVGGAVYLFCFLYAVAVNMPEGGGATGALPFAGDMFMAVAPYAIGGIALWFVIAYFANTTIIRRATGAMPLNRKDNKRVYNLVENLCMTQGMKMPKVNIIYDDSLNAFASGIDGRTYTVTLSKGIIDKLDDEELEAVIAHELSHIRNHDVRLLIVSIVFVGIFAMLAQLSFRSLSHLSYGGAFRSRNSKNNNGGGIIVVMLIALFVAAISYFFAILMRFAISRKREFLADAGSAEMTKRPWALASALHKISADPYIEAVRREDVAQLFIQHPGGQAKSFFSKFSKLFATHPPIGDRIRLLEQF
jgi:heat shock protein HtpX